MSSLSEYWRILDMTIAQPTGKNSTMSLLRTVLMATYVARMMLKEHSSSRKAPSRQMRITDLR